MLPSAYITSYISAFGLVLVGLYLINPIAIQRGLVDRPDGERKQNGGLVPLSGGIAIYLALFAALLMSPIAEKAVPYPLDFWPSTAFLLAVLVFTHMLDDIYDISAVVRLVLDGAIGVLISTIGLLQITTLGYLFGPDEMTLGRWSVAMTVFSFIAASNAFNMTDGIDGLCTGLGIICFATILALLLQTGNPKAADLAHLCMLMILALLAMYLANLGFFGQRMRAFLGDSGARLIGFVAAIVLTYAAGKQFIDPVIVYFPIAIPVCDCLILMGSRALQGRSPLSADRLHLHHLLQDAGLSLQATRACIFALALLYAGIGYWVQVIDLTEWKISVIIVLSYWCVIGIRRGLIIYARKKNPEPVS